MIKFNVQLLDNDTKFLISGQRPESNWKYHSSVSKTSNQFRIWINRRIKTTKCRY